MKGSFPAITLDTSCDRRSAQHNRFRRTGMRHRKRARRVGVDRFLSLHHYLLKSAAWKSLRPVERALYIEVAQRWNGFNNGQIGLGVREAGEALHVKHTTVG